MVSDIKGLNSRQTTGTASREAASVGMDARATQGAAPAPAAADDSVELSGLSDVVRATAKSLAEEPAVDQARVQALKDAIANGDYQINPDRIAQKLVQSDSL
jgi:negative regulator of flagellin synthesis FlgM